MAAAVEDLYDRVREVEMIGQRTADRIVSHEEICAERYKNINESISRMLAVMTWFGGALVIGMAAILVKQVWP